VGHDADIPQMLQRGSLGHFIKKPVAQFFDLSAGDRLRP